MPKKKTPAKKRSLTDGLSKAELQLISDLLYMAKNEFLNHGCNDYTITATDQNRDILKELIMNLYDECDQEEALDDLNESKDELFTFDSTLMEWFAYRCKKLSEKK